MLYFHLLFRVSISKVTQINNFFRFFRLDIRGFYSPPCICCTKQAVYCGVCGISLSMVADLGTENEYQQVCFFYGIKMYHSAIY